MTRPALDGSPVVLVEQTPNPHALKLLLGRPVEGGGGAHFEDAATAREASPLAAELLSIQGVRAVYLGADFASITKHEEADWPTLAPQALERTQQVLAGGGPLLSCAPEPQSPRGDLAELVRAEGVLQALAPLVASHGGELELLSYCDGVLELRLRGACAGCPSSEVTLRQLVERHLREVLPGLREVVARG
jgi:Fe-S cluster biogenesis protein NfuA